MRQMTACNYVKCINSKFNINSAFKYKQVIVAGKGGDEPVPKSEIGVSDTGHRITNISNIPHVQTTQCEPVNYHEWCLR